MCFLHEDCHDWFFCILVSVSLCYLGKEYKRSISFQLACRDSALVPCAASHRCLCLIRSLESPPVGSALCGAWVWGRPVTGEGLLVFSLL